MPSTSEDFNPAENATVKLMWHITEKGFQLGSCVGVAVAGPVSAYKGRHSGTPLSPRVLRALSRSALIGTAVSGMGAVCASIRVATAAAQTKLEQVITSDPTRAAWC